MVAIGGISHDNILELKNCGLDDEKDFEKKEGKNVTLEFNSDGLVEEF